MVSKIITMGLTPEQLIKVTTRAINGHRHEYYHWTVDKAKFYHQIVTGLHQEKLIVSYKPRENDIQKQQRINLYHGRTKSASNKVLAVFDKIKQVEKTLDRIEYAERNDDKEALLKGLVSKFVGHNSVTKYLNTKYKYFNAVDPNAWLIVAQGPTDLAGITKSFPIDVKSHSAYDYKMVDGQLQYLVSCDRKQIATAKDTKTILEYYGFTAGYVVYMAQVDKDVEKTGFYPDHPEQDAPREADGQMEVNDLTFRVWVYPTNSTQTPAIRYGYLPDPSTDQRTFVSVLDAASEEFRDLINRKSEYDLSLALHTFLQKYQVAEPCDFKDRKGKSVDICRDGTLGFSGNTCPSCKGSGLKIHTTSQDIILVKRMDDKEQYIPLSDMAKYIEMPFEIVKHQSMVVKELPKEISEAIFGVDIAQIRDVAVTATEIRNTYDSIYAVLADYADHYSEMYVFAVHQIAQNAQADNGLIVQHKFPRDFELMTLGELLGVLEAAKKAGASFEIIQNIQKHILNKQHQDQPQMIALHETKEKFRPFKHLSEQQKTLTLATLPDDNIYKVLYLYNDLIFSEILQEDKAFLMRDHMNQWQIVEVKIAEFIEKILGLPAEGMRAMIETQLAEPSTDGE